MSQHPVPENPGKCFGDHLGICTGKRAKGTASDSLEIQPQHLQYLNQVHGGVIASLIDHCAGAAAISAIAAGKGVVTASLHVSYIRPGKPPKLHVAAEVIKAGRRQVLVQSKVHNADSQLCALGTATFAVINL